MPKTWIVNINSRLQKGGALLSDMRQIVNHWSEDMAKKDPIPILARYLSKATMARVRDTYIHVFRPRFINGSPPEAWRLVKVLEDKKAELNIVKPFYYWITARSEPPLYGFVLEVVYPRSRSIIDRAIRIEETISWLKVQLNHAGKSWAPSVLKRVAGGIMAALRDFGILEGKVHKRIASMNLIPEAFALIAFCLHQLGITGRELLQHPDWKLFLLNNHEVEHLFLECHQHKWLKFELAGNIYRTEFSETSFKEYVDEVLG